MKITAEPRSDQWNADDFVSGPRVFTIAKVHHGKAEQKYDIELVEGEGRVWRPPLTMLRLLMGAWTDETEQWHGRKVMLYRDESVRFGSDAVGGIRIAKMTDLPTGDKRFEMKLTDRRGHRTPVGADPLTTEEIIAAYKTAWQAADPDARKVIEEQVAKLTGKQDPGDEKDAES